jgi:DNA polymerase
MNRLKKAAGMLKRYTEQMREDGVLYVEGGCSRAVLKKKIAKAVVVRPFEGSLQEMAGEVSSCKKCPLHKSRKNAVLGEGDPQARLMFIGEGPGFDEDRLGRPFVGRSGQLLDKILSAMSLKREEVYITNIVKCHPMIDPSSPDKRGNDRKPESEETNACLPYLERQIELIEPEIICSLGASSAVTLTGLQVPIGKLRGRFYDYKGIKLMPTFHPAALLRNPILKKDVWDDMKLIMKELQAGSGRRKK